MTLPMNRRKWIQSLGACSLIVSCKILQANTDEGYTIPTLDIDGWADHQVIVDREPGQHSSTTQRPIRISNAMSHSEHIVIMDSTQAMSPFAVYKATTDSGVGVITNNDLAAFIVRPMYQMRLARAWPTS